MQPPMKILTSPSSGSIAGTTFSHNRAGQYTRNRRTPVVGTRTPRQAVVKGNMTLSSQAWQALTSAQQAAWISYANGHPIVDALGQSIKLTGSQYFIKCQAALFNVGGPAITDPPVSSSVTPVAPAFSAAFDAPLAVVSWTPGAGTDYVAIAVSKFTSLGVNFQKTYSQIGVSTADIGFFDLTTGFVSFAGSLAVGTKMWVRLTPVNQYGLTGSPVYLQIPVQSTTTVPSAVLTSTVATDLTATFATGPATANVYAFQGPTSAGPWTLFGEDTMVASPLTLTGITSGQYGTVILQDAATGLFGLRPAGHVIM